MSVNPSDFQSMALAWVGAVTVVLVAVAGAVAKVMAAVAAVKQQADSTATRVDAHAADIRSVNEQITAVAQQVPPAPATAPVQFPVVDKSGNVSS